MAKDRRSPYLPGRRTEAWQKVKIRPEQELVVGGWTRGTGTAADLGALLVGVYEDGALRYAGKVGAGFDSAPGRSCWQRSPAGDRRSPFAPPPPRRSRAAPTWVRPDARHPRRVRRLDRRRHRPPGRVQGPRPRQGSTRRPSRGAARRGLTTVVAGERRRVYDAHMVGVAAIRRGFTGIGLAWLVIAFSATQIARPHDRAGRRPGAQPDRGERRQGSLLGVALKSGLIALVVAMADICDRTRPGLARFVLVVGTVAGLLGALSNTHLTPFPGI